MTTRSNLFTMREGDPLRIACFSHDLTHRYYLVISWDCQKQFLCVIGLNPSTADEFKDDPTLRRVQGFARDMNLGGVLMLNAFALRSTDPKGLLAVDDPLGPYNTLENFTLWMRQFNCITPVAAWGGNPEKHKKLRGRVEELNQLQLDCFRQTKMGHPEHPLYLPASLRPRPWNY